MFRLLALAAAVGVASAALDLSYSLPSLPYNYTELEPVIDTETMMLHHQKHTDAYTQGLNRALEGLRAAGSPLVSAEDQTVEKLVAAYAEAPEAVSLTLRNYGGGYVNHVSFFEAMRAPRVDNTPLTAINGGAVLNAALEFAFGSFDGFKTQFAADAKAVFGSGWTWLLVNPDDGSVSLMSTANQDNPAMAGKIAILGLDVWEHAYYKTYGPDRGAYTTAWYDVVNWDVVAKRYLDALMPGLDIAELLPPKPLKGPTTVTVTTTTIVGSGIKGALAPAQA